MIRPPERFGQMLIAQLGGPALVFGLFAGCARGMGADRSMMLAVATFGGLSAAFWFGWVAWCSRFGSLHMRLAPPVLSGMVLWPFSQLLLPVTGMGNESARLVGAGTLIWHGTILCCAALWHWRIAGVGAQAQAKTLRWTGISIQLSKRVITPCTSRDVNSLGTAGWAAAASRAPRAAAPGPGRARPAAARRRCPREG